MLKHHSPAKSGHSIKKTKKKPKKTKNPLCGTCALSVCDTSLRGTHLLQNTAIVFN